MDIKNKPTLAEKQAFWAEQLPNFEAKYWLPSHFELLEFDMEGGNYEVRDVLPGHYSEDDATEIWHRVNTGWAMWKKAINFTKAQVPEGRTDFEIINQTIELVDLLASSTNVYQRDPKSNVHPFESKNPRVMEWWRAACKIQDLLTQTDPENCDFEEYKAMIEAQEQAND